MEIPTLEIEWTQEKAMRAELKALIDELDPADLLLLSSELMQRFGVTMHEEKERAGLSFDTDYEQVGASGTACSRECYAANGMYQAGKAGILSIGFGPGDEKTAHMIDERVPLQEVVDATEFYALLPYLLKNNL